MNISFVLVDLAFAGQVWERTVRVFEPGQDKLVNSVRGRIEDLKGYLASFDVSVLTAIPIVAFDISLPVAGYPLLVAI